LGFVWDLLHNGGMAAKSPVLDVSKEPNIRLGKDGRYWWEIEKKRANGSKFRKAGACNELSKAIEKRDAALSEFADNSAEKSYSLGDWFDVCAKTIWPDDLRSSTIYGYTTLFNKHVRTLLGDILIDKLSPLDVRGLTRKLLNAGLDADSVANVRNVLSKCYTTAQAHEVVKMGVNPAKVVTINRSKKLRDENGDHIEHTRPLSLTEQAHLLDIARGSWAYPAVLLGLKLGLRRGEILAANIRNVDFERKTYSVKAQVKRENGAGMQLSETKTQSSDRTIPVPPSAMDWFREQRDAGCTGYLMLNTSGSFISQEDLRKAFIDLVCIARLTNGKDDRGKALPDPTLHDLRHSFGFTMANVHNVKLQTLAALMGHKSMQTTMDYYVAVDQDDMRAAMDQLG
jgi:integrase